MKDRIKELRKSLDLTQTEFGQKVGVATSTITGYELGSRVPSDAIIRSICREFNVNETWLRTGEGAMLVDRTREEELGAYLKTVLADRPDSFRSALLTTLLRFDTEGPEWEVLERIYRKLSEQMKTPEP